MTTKQTPLATLITAVENLDINDFLSDLPNIFGDTEKTTTTNTPAGITITTAQDTEHNYLTGTLTQIDDNRILTISNTNGAILAEYNAPDWKIATHHNR